MSQITAEATETTAILAPPHQLLRMSYEEYLAWEHEGSLAEWVDGEVVVQIPPKSIHQDVVEFLYVLVRLFVQSFDLGKVRIAPFTMRTVPYGNAREPDILFLTTDHLDRLTEREVRGPADLVIEVVSDDSVARDRDQKFLEYQQAGVREYWIIDPRPNRQRADFFVLNTQGVYQPVPIPEQIYHATVLPDFWLNVNWLWHDDTNPLVALAEIVGVERVTAALRG